MDITYQDGRELARFCGSPRQGWWRKMEPNVIYTVALAEVHGSQPISWFARGPLSLFVVIVGGRGPS